MKKVKALLCCFLAFLTLSGCASMLEGEYTSVRQPDTALSDEENPFPVIHAETYEEILDALMTMIRTGEEFGVIRITTYEGDVVTAVNDACMEITNNTPLGSYAVYYLTGTVNRIISYYDAEINITYKRTLLELANITSVTSLRTLDSELRYYMGVNSSRETISVNFPEVTPEYISRRIGELYYDDPSLCSVLPSVSVEEYPPGGDERILELTFRYPYTVARVTDMQEKILNAADELAASVEDLQKGEAVLRLCETLAATVEYDLEREQTGGTDFHLSDTAFGALIDGKASGLGFAMATKLLCDKLGVECVVVQGRRDSMDHGWNIICLDGDYYHVDASVFTQVGAENAYLIGDTWMSDRCWWDQTLYPACNGPLAYGDFAPAAAMATPAPTPAPSEAVSTPAPEAAQAPEESAPIPEE